MKISVIPCLISLVLFFSFVTKQAALAQANLPDSTQSLHNQLSTDTTSEEGFWGRIFLPSIEVGYQIPNSSVLGGAVRFGTSIEYRIRNNNDFFIRLNYDTYGARYDLKTNNATTNSLQGTVQFTDIMLAPGYRFGDRTFRFMFCIMPGVKVYDFPSAVVNNQQILVSQQRRYIFSTSVLGTLEYYFDEKSALTFSLFQNQVYKQQDFWPDGGSAYGFSIGFITSLL
jgi:hypothetical protein